MTNMAIPTDDLFFISNPETQGIGDNGTIAPGKNGTISYRIISTTEAALLEETFYSIEGQLTYSMNGQTYALPLLPADFLVLPGTITTHRVFPSARCV